MTYIPEGSPKQYQSSLENPNPFIYSWGWLGNKVETKNQGWNDQALKEKICSRMEKLAFSDEHCIRCTRGIHGCEMCRDGMGNAEIYISYRGKIYICPSGVYHYIEAHDYKPDDEVIKAILNGYYCTEKDLTPDWEKASVDWDKRHMTDEEDAEMQRNIDKEWDRLDKAIILKGWG